MNYGQVRDFVLKLLNQYTVVGEQIPGSYNTQIDYLNRIPALVNDAMTEIATTARKLPVVLDLADVDYERQGELLRYQLPEDFFELVTGGVRTTQYGGTPIRTSLFALQGKDSILIPDDAAGKYIVEYNRYPRLLSEKPADTDELDGEPVTHMAIPYYVAAHIVIHDDPFLYQSFYNKYEDKLAKMFPGITVEQSQVQDNYEAAFWGGDF